MATEDFKPVEEIGKSSQSCLMEVVLLGFSDFQELQVLLFVLVLLFYLFAFFGNLLTVIVTLEDPALHTPMYFFLRNLSFLEVSYTSVTIPKMLVDLLSETQTISFVGCGVQMFFFLLFASTECSLLAVMAYDRYVAICNPLQYTLSMNQRVCTELSAIAWTFGTLVAFSQTLSVFTKPFCGANTIRHFFCEIVAVLTLASTDTHTDEVAITVLTVPLLMVPFLLILLSYVFIISTILKMPSAEGRSKAFSTCSSHLIVVLLFYGSGTFVYMEPASVHSQSKERFFSLVYTVLTPTVNPIIYSLRNKEMKSAVKETIGQKVFS